MASVKSPEDVRRLAREGNLTGPTAGFAPGFTQANLVILPREHALPFLLFCQRNPRPCPVLEVTEPGDPVPRKYAPSADLRTDLPRYRIWRDGELAGEPTDIADLWRDDFVSFLIGCSFTFESALLEAGLPVRHFELGCNVPMYRTRIECTPAPPFAGNLVVSMRPFLPSQAIQAIEITSRFPAVHGAPVHFGDPAQIGIEDLDRPDFGDRVDVRPGETPVFWACGVTPQVALVQARLPLVITHSPGHMFVTDRRDVELSGI